MFNENKLDEQMKPYWDKLKSRLDLQSPDDIGKLFAERAVYDFAGASGFRLSDDQRKSIVQSVQNDSPKSTGELLNCIVRHIGKIPAKTAYPVAPYRYISKDKEKEGMFLGLAARAQNFVSAGIKESDAIRRVLNNVPIDDRLNFLSWYGFKRGGEWKYLALAQREDGMIKVAYEDDGSFVYEFMRHREPEQAAKDQKVPDVMSAEEFKRMRDKMVGRTFAIDKLLEKHRHLISDEQLDSVEDVLNNLRKNIRRLKLAGLQDSIEKTAFIAEQNSWFEGAIIVRALMESDEQFAKTAAHASADLLGQVIESLTETAAHLRQRALIRDIAARDIDLFNLGYGHIGDVGDATAKLMEAFNSAANKIEDVASRLRGELQQQTNPKTMPTKVRTIVQPEDLPLVKALEPGPPQE